MCDRPYREHVHSLLIVAPGVDRGWRIPTACLFYSSAPGPFIPVCQCPARDVPESASGSLSTSSSRQPSDMGQCPLWHTRFFSRSMGGSFWGEAPLHLIFVHSCFTSPGCLHSGLLFESSQLCWVKSRARREVKSQPPSWIHLLRSKVLSWLG